MSIAKLLCLSALILLINSEVVLSQTDELTIPYLPQQGASIKSFVPENWKITYKATGNLNADSLPDVILVLEFTGGEYVDVSVEQANELEWSKNLPRLLIILFKTKNGYRLSTASRKIIACERCGGIHGDPFDGIVIKNRAFITKFYAGSGWRGRHNHRFKYINNNWYLIGRTNYTYHLGGNIDDESFLKVDYQKHTLYKRHGKKKVWKNIEKAPLMLLSNFDITNENHLWGTKEERE